MSYDEMQKEIARSCTARIGYFECAQTIAKAGAWVENHLPVEEKPFIKPWMIDRADDNYELIIDKVRQELGWTPTYTLRGTLPEMLEGLKVIR